MPWPTGGTAHDFLNNFRRHIQSHLDSSDVYLLYDRYKEGSIKESTRNYRDQGASRVYSLRPTAKLPSQKVILTVSSNKKQLIGLILTELIHHKDMLNGKLVITGNDPVPFQINQGVVSRRDDMTIQARIQLLTKGVVVIMSCRRRHKAHQWGVLATLLVGCVVPPL